jgi:hypothetical protein
MKTRDPVLELLRRLLPPQSIPSPREERQKPFTTPLPDDLPQVPMWLLPPAITPGAFEKMKPYIPTGPVDRSPAPFPGPQGPDRSILPPEFNPLPPWVNPYGLPAPAVPDRPPTQEKEIDLDRIGGARPSTGLASSSRSDRLDDPLATLAALVRLSAMRDWPA